MTEPYYQDEKTTIHHGDCLEVMADMPAESIDAIVTDPPYGLGFMGREWDALPPGREWAEECLRVLKPGGHLLAFGGSRTWHRLAVAIEDGGFEIRDSIFWHYGEGFPKSQNVSRALGDKRCGCAVPYNHDNVSRKDVPAVRKGLAAEGQVPGGTREDVLSGMRRKDEQRITEGTTGTQRPAGNDPVCGMRETGQDPAGMGEAQQADLLLTSVQRGGSWQRVGEVRSSRECGAEDLRGQEGRAESSLEGRGDVQASERELRGAEVRPMPGGMEDDGTGGRVHHGAPAGHGSMGGPTATADRSGQSHQPQPSGQPAGESGAIPVERGSQAGGSWPVCARCGKPQIPDGLGTALKPATEPVVVARKPLAENTVAANVLEHGTGAINVDATRVGTETRLTWGAGSANYKVSNPEDWRQTKHEVSGRWPANVVLDEHCAGVLDEQSGESKSTASVRKRSGTSAGNGETLNHYAINEDNYGGYSDSGGASRFFYCAKAPKSERPKVDGTAHPTVKPLSLMRWLVRMVTPPGGTVLDPFAGSGTTIEAALTEGFNSIGIELTDEYLPLIQHRIERATETTMF